MKNIFLLSVLIMGLSTGTVFGQGRGLGQGRGKEGGPSLAQLKKAAAEMSSQIQAIKDYSTKAVQDAKKSNDAARVDCMAQPFTYLRALEGLAGKYSASFELYAEAGDLGRAKEEFAKLSTTMGKVNSVGDELKSCGGPPSSELSEQDVEKEKDKDLPEIEEVGLDSVVLIPVLTRPSLTSPTH